MQRPWGVQPKPKNASEVSVNATEREERRRFAVSRFLYRRSVRQTSLLPLFSLLPQ